MVEDRCVLQSEASADIIEYYLYNPKKAESLFKQARAVRDYHFDSKVFVYGFNYFSTYCRNRCAFCHYRNGNALAPRYRHGIDEVVSSAELLADSGVNLIDLTMGEDPYYIDAPERLVKLVAAVSERTHLPIMVSPGVISADILHSLKDAGAVWFALYQETFDKKAYSKLRVGQSFSERLELKRAARQAGLLVEEGILTGWGDTTRQIAESLIAIDTAQPSQIRVMTFVPQPGTPLENRAATSNERELIVIALMRLMHPDLLIPASLDVEGPQGLRSRLDAGANVITSIIPPGTGLEGVARNADIEDGGRTLEGILPIIHDAGLKTASQKGYDEYITKRRSLS